jgi:hypothetical protein
MNRIKKLRQNLSAVLKREPTIHEEIDYLILEVCRDRAYELRLAYQINPNENYKEAYDFTVKCCNMIVDRNPQIFGTDDEGTDDGYE